MSRFFAGGGSSSESEDESTFSEDGRSEKPFVKQGSFFAAASDESDDDSTGFGEDNQQNDSEASSFASDSEASEESQAGSDGGEAAPRKSRFLFGGSDSESDEDDMVQRVVRSQREKLMDELDELAGSIEDGIDTDAWIGVLSDFERLCKIIPKAVQSNALPKSIIDVFESLNNAIGGLSAEEKKKLNADDAKAFNSLRQKLRKVTAQWGDSLKAASISTEGDKDEEEAGEDLPGLTKGIRKVTISEATSTASLASLPLDQLKPDQVLKKLAEVVGQRGRKHADRLENLATLRKLYEIASKNPRHQIHVLVGIISTSFDLLQAAAPMALEIWTAAVSDLHQLVSLLTEHMKGLAVEKDSDVAGGSKTSEEEEGLPNASSLRGTLLSYLHRIDDEFTRNLQNIDAHTTEYVEFLRAEPLLLTVLRQAALFFGEGDENGSSSPSDAQCQVSLRILEHLYFRHASTNARLFGESFITVPEICRLLYVHGSERVRVRAFLCHIYHLALHGHYNAGRDMLIQSHLPDLLYTLDIPGQILYNRTLVQLGLAAFRQGRIKEAYYALQELCSTGRPKELLAQTISSHGSGNAEQERLERQRQLPAHMHLSVEAIDGVFLVVSMLLEIPQQAASQRRFFKGERKPYPSRHLRRLLDLHERALFNGPPENTREHLIAACKALSVGNWSEAVRLTMAVRIWDLMPDPAGIRAMLTEKIQMSAFCAFIYSFGLYYRSVSVSHLQRQFNLPQETTNKLIGKLVRDYGIPAKIISDQDEEEPLLVWNDDAEVSAFQEKILQLGEKIDFMSDRTNETLEILAAIPAALLGRKDHHQNHYQQQQQQNRVPEPVVNPASVEF